MTANITRTIEEMKEEAELKGRADVAMSLLDVLDDETIAIKTKLPLEKIKELCKQKKMKINNTITRPLKVRQYVQLKEVFILGRENEKRLY